MDHMGVRRPRGGGGGAFARIRGSSDLLPLLARGSPAVHAHRGHCGHVDDDSDAGWSSAGAPAGTCNALATHAAHTSYAAAVPCAHPTAPSSRPIRLAMGHRASSRGRWHARRPGHRSASRPRGHLLVPHPGRLLLRARRTDCVPNSMRSALTTSCSRSSARTARTGRTSRVARSASSATPATSTPRRWCSGSTSTVASPTCPTTCATPARTSSGSSAASDRPC